MAAVFLSQEDEVCVGIASESRREGLGSSGS